MVFDITQLYDEKNQIPFAESDFLFYEYMTTYRFEFRV